jgi:alpha-D-ribose 1-methylphosphonate 5-triphosphate synthase subunit PhnL
MKQLPEKSPTNVILSIKNLGKSFYIHELKKTIQACSGISLDISQGEFVGIIGRSGSGKSTILKMIYRTYLAQEGTISYHSKDLGWVNLGDLNERNMIHLRKFEIGYVSQFLNVIPRSTARGLIEQAVLEMGYPKDEALDRARAMLHHFELAPELWDAYVSTFSGGEKLRVNIARAMVKEPRLLLLDEPTASLDSYTKARVKELIQKLKEAGTTMIGIFHDIEFMEGLCDRQFTMAQGKGQI